MTASTSTPTSSSTPGANASASVSASATAPPPPPSTSTSTTTTIITNITQDPTIPNVPQAYQARAAWLNKERLAVQHFAVASKKAKGIPDLTSTMHAVQLERTVQLVNFLEHAFAISPEYRRDTQIDVALRLMFAHDEFHFPADLKRRAEALVRGWEEAHWGDVVPAVDGEDDDDGDDGDGGQASTTLPTGSTAITTTTAAVITTTTAAAITTAATTTATTNTAATTTAITATATATATAPAAAPAAARIILRPPPDHPIWGVNGIMHGVMVSMHGQKKDKMLDDRYQRRDADVLGANGLVAGQWWPNQMAALFWGAHGHSQAGVFGSVKYGAISIVVAGTYKDLDDDRGDTIYYSAPGSKDNQDGTSLPRAAAIGWLQRSVTTGRPVRVLRRANNKSAFAPSVGIRYDGLYRVVAQELPLRRNAHGGLYTRYVLRRVPDQRPSLGEVQARSPTVRQMSDYRRVGEYW